MLRELKILKVEFKDADIISQMILPLAIVHFKPIISSFNALSIAKNLQDPTFNYYKAEIKNSLCGVISLRDNTHVYHLFVAEKYQRQGIARALWEYAKFEAKTKGNDGIFTVNSSLNAVETYEHLGFNKVNNQQEKNGINYVPMQYTGW